MANPTVAELAGMLGISIPTLNEYVRSGQLVRENKRIDLTNPTNIAWLQSYRPANATKASRHYTSPEDEEKLDEIRSFDAEEILAKLQSLDINKLTLASVQKLHRIEQTLKVRVEREEKRKLLIDRRLVATVFGRLYTIDTNELRTLGSKLAPELAGILGVEDPAALLAVEKRIDDEVLKSLQHIKRVMDDFLRNVGVTDDGS